MSNVKTGAKANFVGRAPPPAFLRFIRIPSSLRPLVPHCTPTQVHDKEFREADTDSEGYAAT